MRLPNFPLVNEPAVPVLIFQNEYFEITTSSQNIDNDILLLYFHTLGTENIKIKCTDKMYGKHLNIRIPHIIQNTYNIINFYSRIINLDLTNIIRAIVYNNLNNNGWQYYAFGFLLIIESPDATVHPVEFTCLASFSLKLTNILPLLIKNQWPAAIYPKVIPILDQLFEPGFSFYLYFICFYKIDKVLFTQNGVTQDMSADDCYIFGENLNDCKPRTDANNLNPIDFEIITIPDIDNHSYLYKGVLMPIDSVYYKINIPNPIVRNQNNQYAVLTWQIVFLPPFPNTGRMDLSPIRWKSWLFFIENIKISKNDEIIFLASKNNGWKEGLTGQIFEIDLLWPSATYDQVQYIQEVIVSHSVNIQLINCPNMYFSGSKFFNCEIADSSLNFNILKTKKQDIRLKIIIYKTYA